ncbi:alpha/beta fold hydrolase [Rhizohabitans arisaemae]|uniref:alpha/beta fold hydrolase n=1 Tax=Rhizohabitans arisaemae TaxID=2720610 RepID=UPI0024B158A9|nr:alpha/beta hydrolase [Rhizohabitans arisaemae]
MSTPRFLTLPPGVSPYAVRTETGTFAALEALPVNGVAERWPALLVPGLTGSKEDFISVLQTLAQAGRRILTIDMRGQYETIGPDDPLAYSCAALGEDIESIIASLGEPVHLVGHSFGGLVCRETVLAGKVGVASFTLMSSGPAALTGSRRGGARMLIERLPVEGIETIWNTRMEPDAIASGTPDDVIDFLRKRMLANSTAGLIGMCRELLSAPDRCDELAEHQVPKLVLCGERDDVWSPLVQAEMAQRLNAECVVVPSAAHSPCVEAPETTAAALNRFWSEAERSAIASAPTVRRSAAG